jgi:hypothetical protein
MIEPPLGMDFFVRPLARSKTFVFAQKFLFSIFRFVLPPSIDGAAAGSQL